MKLESGTTLYRVSENEDIELFVEELSISDYDYGDYIAKRQDGSQIVVLREDVGKVAFLKQNDAINVLTNILDRYHKIQPKEYYEMYSGWAVREGLYEIKD